MERKFISNIVIEKCKIKYRNLKGEATQYNRAGDRNFSVILTDKDLIAQLKADGWNVKCREKNADGDLEYTLPVSVAYYNSKGEKVRNPPRIYTYARGVKTELDEEDVGNIDTADIASVDLTIRPYCWETARGSGVKAYLKNMYVTLVVDELDEKWSHVGETNDNEEDDGDIPF